MLHCCAGELHRSAGSAAHLPLRKRQRLPRPLGGDVRRLHLTLHHSHLDGWNAGGGESLHIQCFIVWAELCRQERAFNSISC